MFETKQYIDWFKAIVGAEEPESDLITRAEIEEMKKRLSPEYQVTEREMPEAFITQRIERLFSENSGSDALHIVTSRPESQEDCNRILEQLQDGIAVIVNFENNVCSKSVQIINYLCGGIYVLRGRAVRISDSIIIFLPENVEISMPGK